MSESKKPSFLRLKFPKGRALYAWLSQPDTKFKAEGQYKVNVVMAKADAEKLIAIIDEATEKAVETAKEKIAELKGKGGKHIAKAKEKLEKLTTAYPYEPVYDDDGEETDEVVFKFTMPASYLDKKTDTRKDIQPRLWDAKNNRIKDVDIFNGSILKVNAELRPYYADAADKAGVSMRPVDVQVIELVSGGGGRSPFDEEDGYEFAEGDKAAPREAQKAPADFADDDGAAADASDY